MKRQRLPHRSQLALGYRWPVTAGDPIVIAMPKATGVVTTNEA